MPTFPKSIAKFAPIFKKQEVIKNIKKNIKKNAPKFIGGGNEGGVVPLTSYDLPPFLL
jgi:hypothetical protein